MTDNELKDECMENAEIDLRRYSNDELTQIREAMRMYADRKLKLFAIPDVSQRSKLLKAFYAYVDDKWALGMLTDKVDEVIEGFEKSL